MPNVGVVRSEGLEPPRFYSLPPQGSASTNSATSAWDTGWSDAARRINGADVTNQGWGDKAVLRPNNYLTSGDFGSICLTSTAIRLRSTSTTPLATGRLLARILTSSASVASSSMMAPRDLVDGHGGGAEHHHEIDTDFIEGGHCETAKP